MNSNNASCWTRTSESPLKAGGLQPPGIATIRNWLILEPVKIEFTTPALQKQVAALVHEAP